MTHYQLAPYQKQKIEEYFYSLKVDDCIYPGQIKSKFVMDVKDVYVLLEELKHEGYLEYLFEIYCFECNKSTGLFIDSLSDFKADTYCDFCNHELNVMDNIIVLYKVVKN